MLGSQEETFLDDVYVEVVLFVSCRHYSSDLITEKNQAIQPVQPMQILPVQSMTSMMWWSLLVIWCDCDSIVPRCGGAAISKNAAQVLTATPASPILHFLAHQCYTSHLAKKTNHQPYNGWQVYRCAPSSTAYHRKTFSAEKSTEFYRVLQSITAMTAKTWKAGTSATQGCIVSSEFCLVGLCLLLPFYVY